jgi:hypothetical protein
MESFLQDSNVEILLGTWSNGSLGFSLDAVDVIGNLYFLESMYDGYPVYIEKERQQDCKHYTETIKSSERIRRAAVLPLIPP